MHPEIKKLSGKKLENRIKSEEERLVRVEKFFIDNPDMGRGWKIAAESIRKELEEMHIFADSQNKNSDKKKTKK